MSRGRRTERGRLWACLYAGLFGGSAEDASGETEADADADGEREGSVASESSDREAEG